MHAYSYVGCLGAQVQHSNENGYIHQTFSGISTPQGIPKHRAFNLFVQTSQVVPALTNRWRLIAVQ
eukprot:scaffold114036_cov18-Tisochrysis_lutea.AAC.1